ncbi:hypothetical protein NQZ68_001084 [Dissostichus eleginoides]|nr:hypothetical protein NQZ68_001084 [Dissostichus eleginoides]
MPDTYSSRILSDRPLPAELGRVIGIQDHLDDREGGEFRETQLPCLLSRATKFPQPVPPFAQRGEEIEIASPGETLSVRGKQLSMHEEKSPSGLCCSPPTSTATILITLPFSATL